MEYNTEHCDSTRPVGFMRRNRRLFTLSGSLLLTLCVRHALAEDYFDPAALEMSTGQQKAADLSYFAKQGGQQPGTYKVHVYLDQQQVDTRDVEFVSRDGKLEPVLTEKYLRALGVNTPAFSTFKSLHEGESFTQLGKYIPDGFSKFDFATQRLDISVPQAALNMQSRGYVPPEQWDEGIPAAFVDYNFSGSSTDSRDSHYQSNFLNLRSGVNLGAWRLRNYSSYQYDKKGRWQSQSTWLQRDIASLKAQLKVGDTYTSGQVFDSIQFRGLNLESDDDMLPDSQRGFAPTIRGVAHSNARVSIRQHGYVIYETYVSPGAFAINDLYPTSQSGDLEVTIRESDGSERKFTQPYSAVPFMLREGRFKFSVNGGRYKSSASGADEPDFMEATAFYGLPWSLTLYGGTQLSSNYRSLAVGLGRDFGEMGSLGVDGTQANTDLGGRGTYSGQAFRIQYQKQFLTTGTSFSMANYRYSTRNFYEFSEANQYRDDAQQNLNNRRDRAQVTVNQDFESFGNLSMSLYQQSYWNSDRKDQTMNLGYYNSYQGISWGVAYYYTRSSSDSPKEQSVTFNVSVPLSKWLLGSSVSYSMNNDTKGHATQQMSLYGTALANNNLNYNIQQGYDNRDKSANSSVNLDYRGGYGDASVGYGHDRSSDRISYGLTGGIVASQYGVTLSQTLGDTIGLVRAKGSDDAQVEGMTNVHTDSRGYAVVPTLSPYHKNTVSLDTETLGDNVDIDQNSAVVIPTRGAVVLADYKTHVGARVLVNLTHDGAPLPFGAEASVTGSDDDKSNTGIVGDQGLVYLSGVPAQGQLQAHWQDNGQDYQCTAPIAVPENNGTGNGNSTTTPAVKIITAVCH